MKNQVKKLTKELIEESDEESISELFEESDEESNEMFKKSTKIKTSNKDKNTTDWYYKNKFKKILTTIDNNGFNHKNKIGKLKFNNINDLIKNIKNNTISKADAKKKINELNEIKKVEIKRKRLINGQKILLNLFDDLVKAILNNSNNNINNSNNNNNNKSNNSNNNGSDSENENESLNKDENENENKSDSENENESVNKDENENENESDDEQYYEIKQLNNWFKTIDKTKSFKEQIEILKTKDSLDEYWYVGYYHGNKELNYKIFAAKAAHLLNNLDEQLFEKIFGNKFAALVDKLTNTIDEEENKIIIDDIKKIETKFLSKMNIVNL